MTKYETRAVTIGDITVTVSKAASPSAADRIQAVLEFLADKIVDPDYGIGVGGHPDQGLPPEHGRPDQGLPGGGGSTKPVEPDEGTPDQGLPHEKLANFLKNHAKEIAGAILKGTLCDPAQPKK